MFQGPISEMNILEERDLHNGHKQDWRQHRKVTLHTDFPFFMKTPERWRALPRRALFVSILARKSSTDVKTSQDVMPWHHDAVPWRHDVVLWRHDVVLWRHMTSGVMKNWPCVIHPAETSKITVFQPGDLDLGPMTLTFEVIRDIIKVNASTKFRDRMSNGSAGRALTDEHTHTQTHRRTGPIPYPQPLTREGKCIVEQEIGFAKTFCTQTLQIYSMGPLTEINFPETEVSDSQISLYIIVLIMTGEWQQHLINCSIELRMINHLNNQDLSLTCVPILMQSINSMELLHKNQVVHLFSFHLSKIFGSWVVWVEEKLLAWHIIIKT